jgi:hypothetical protein
MNRDTTGREKDILNGSRKVGYQRGGLIERQRKKGNKLNSIIKLLEKIS